MDINRLLGSFLGPDVAGSLGNTARDVGAQAKSAASNVPGGVLGGVAAGGLMGYMLGNKKARKFGKKALTYGGMAAVGGLAYKAYRDYQNNKQAPAPTAPMGEIAAPPRGSGFVIEDQVDIKGLDMRLALVIAMISAAKADGHIDADENVAIQNQIQTTDLAADEKAFLFDYLNAPADPIAIAAHAKGEEQAAELYLASALCIDVDTAEERRYMQRLGDALRLPDGLRSQLDAHAAQAKA